MPRLLMRRRCLAVVATSLLVAVALGACDTDDGREMREPTELQRWRLEGTTSTTTSTTTLPPTTPPVLATIPDGLSSDSTADASQPDGSRPDRSASEASGPDASEASLVGPGTNAADDPSTDAVALTAPWPDGEAIGVEFTCDGVGDAPLLDWSAPPAGTAELALTFVDADANSYVHWVVFGLPATAGSIGGDAPLEAGTEGRNSRSGVGWTEVCPPAGTNHGYVVTLHFLSQQLEETADAAPSALVAAIQAVTFDEVAITGTYQRA